MHHRTQHRSNERQNYTKGKRAQLGQCKRLQGHLDRQKDSSALTTTD